jgi:hypothetical protein
LKTAVAQPFEQKVGSKKLPTEDSEALENRFLTIQKVHTPNINISLLSVKQTFDCLIIKIERVMVLLQRSH